jgi:hypothetical protein
MLVPDAASRVRPAMSERSSCGVGHGGRAWGDPVTVGAQQREVAEPRAAWAGGVERHEMAALDVSVTALSVRLFEVEAAGLAG